MGIPHSWMVYFMEKPIKMDDLGVPPFMEAPVRSSLQRFASRGISLCNRPSANSVAWRGSFPLKRLSGFSRNGTRFDFTAFFVVCPFCCEKPCLKQEQSQHVLIFGFLQRLKCCDTLTSRELETQDQRPAEFSSFGGEISSHLKLPSGPKTPLWSGQIAAEPFPDGGS